MELAAEMLEDSLRQSGLERLTLQQAALESGYSVDRVRRGTDQRYYTVIACRLSFRLNPADQDRRLAKAANRAIHLSFPTSCRDSDPYSGT